MPVLSIDSSARAGHRVAPGARRFPLSIALPVDPWLRAALVLWGLLAPIYVAKAVFSPIRHSVFPIFAAASNHWWQGLPLYERYGSLDLYRYSPTFAVLLTPFAKLPPWLGASSWNLLGIGLLLLGLRALMREVLPVLPVDWTPRQEGIYLMLALAGSVRGIWSAQSNAHLLGMCLLAAAALLRRRFGLAAALLAGAVLVKVWPIVLVLLFVMYWPRALLRRLFLAGGAFGALPLLTAHPARVLDAFGEWVGHLVSSSALRWRGNRDAWTILETFGPVDPELYRWLQATTAVGVLIWCLRLRSTGPSTRRLLTLTLAMWAAWQLLFGPGSERLTYGLIAPFTAWAMLVSPTRPLRALSGAAWLLTALLGTGAVERALLPLVSSAPAIQPFGVLVFLVWLLIYAGRRRCRRARELV